MKFGIRGKLFGISIALILLIGGASSIILERETRGWYRARLDEDLRASANTARMLIERAPSDVDLKLLSRELGEATLARVTIIDDDGRVLGDSVLDPETLANHGDRPEVREAFENGNGQAQRRSVTARREMIYVAVRADCQSGPCVIRIAMPAAEIEGAVGRLRGLIVFASLASLLVAVFMSTLASHLMSRALRNLVESARNVFSGPTGRRLSVQGTDELGGIAGSFNQLAEELERTVGTLAQERNRFEATLESMSEAVIALDSEERITLVNKAALSLLRLTSPPSGRTLVEVVRAPALIELVKDAQDKVSHGTEFELHGPKPKRVMARATPLRATGGLVIVLHDVTDLRRLETIRRDFVANVSHELRTPVSIIRANVETLIDGALADPKQAPKFLDALSRSADRLSQLVADLLDISRIEAGAYKLEPGPVAVRTAIDRAVESVAIAAEQKKLSLRAEGDATLRALADPRALDQVLMNLVDNAVKYTPSGGTIVVRAKVIEDGVRIEVTDDGPGIEPRHRTRIFERFYRVDEGRSRAMGGTGLGLAIVKHLTEAMRGQVGVDAGNPRGSVFWVELLPENASAVASPEEQTALATAAH